jgi:hypothetical protein
MAGLMGAQELQQSDLLFVHTVTKEKNISDLQILPAQQAQLPPFGPLRALQQKEEDFAAVKRNLRTEQQ